MDRGALALRGRARRRRDLRDKGAQRGSLGLSRHSSTDAKFQRVATRMMVIGQRLSRARQAVSVWKPQFPLDRLKARLVTERIKQRICLETAKPRVSQSQSRIQPLERPVTVTALCVDLSELVS